MNTDQTIGVAQYYSGKVAEERVKDEKIAEGKHLESLIQRSSCWGALLKYLDHRDFQSLLISEIFKEHGKTSTGFENVIFFLEEKFDDANRKMMPYVDAAKNEIALTEALKHLREIMAYLEIHGGIDEEEGRQIIHRASEFTKNPIIEPDPSKEQEMKSNLSTEQKVRLVGQTFEVIRAVNLLYALFLDTKLQSHVEYYFQYHREKFKLSFHKAKPTEEMFTDAELDKVFAHSNFGNTPKRDIVKYAVLKSASGYHNGHTAQCIIRELGLVNANGDLLKKGREFLWQQFGKSGM